VNATGQPPWLGIGSDHITIELTVRPSAGKQGIVSVRPTGPVVALKSAPEKNRANRELIEFLADALEVPLVAISIVKGQTTRQKAVRIDTRQPCAVSTRIITRFKV
jgi:uncharacterized protein (TIGR00251 family)